MPRQRLQGLRGLGGLCRRLRDRQRIDAHPHTRTLSMFLYVYLRAASVGLQFQIERVIIERGEIIGLDVHGFRAGFALDPVQPGHGGTDLDLLAFSREGEIKQRIQQFLPPSTAALVMQPGRGTVGRLECWSLCGLEPGTLRRTAPAGAL